MTTSIKLTNFIRDAYVEACMSDVPKPDYKSLEKEAQDLLYKAMSPAVRKVFREDPKALKYDTFSELADRGYAVDSLIRNPEHAADIKATGAKPVILDIESAEVDQLAEAFTGASAIVFSAGAGGGRAAQHIRQLRVQAPVLQVAVRVKQVSI